MDEQAKKTALRMIPYGIYVATADDGNGNLAAATVNWVTQTAFAPPLVAMGVKTDSGLYGIAKTRTFALNMLGKDQVSAAFAFFKPADVQDGKVSGEPYSAGPETGSPILKSAQASIECEVREIVELGDHHVFLGEVVGANVAKAPEGRPDAAILEMKDLGDNVFYGG